ncbi:ATP-binding cassette sub-family C member 4-like [Anthonomus grandis grandis]|uniref:ATP-binding cassette sub-family C member 4-like n=1 Tax=Anthonomus grandis grandis TaxID=2921223 RepID=UPI0021653C6C|nr:ATP-binding cassette sub-family C member 4-like [Anthonomus grandis grandis]
MDGAFKLKRDSPWTKANVVSKLFFTWTIPLFYKGSKRKIQMTDLYKTLPSDRSERLGDKLEYYWNKQLKRSKEKTLYKPSLLKALVKTFFWDYSVSGLIFLVYHILIRSPQPLVLAWFVQQFELDTINQNSMYLWASVLNMMSLFGIFLMHHGNYSALAVGMRVRVAVSSLIYRKIMKLNKASQGQTATGQVINILSNDVQRFDQVTTLLHFIWIIPIQVALVTYLMWNMVGVYCLVGIGAMIIITIPLQTYFGKLSSKLRLQVATRCDVRVKHMSEIISGIQVIKMYAWEKPFEKLIEHLRAREISALTRSSYLRGFYSSCNVFVERLTLFLTVVTYSLVGYNISADVVFSLAQFFNILQLALAILYPLTVSQSAESWVAIKRLETILKLEEKEDSKVEKVVEKGIKLDNVTASWVKETPILKGLSLHVSEGQLCAVIGPVGAGKSSLLQLLLGELPPTTGSIQLGGGISYSSQEPWLFAASVRKNILFGKPYDSVLYKKVTEVCALEKDFEQLPYGDRTSVGERGVSLSGGQRARINLARAIYRQADIYLMDDPLSAVDTHVGKHLFERCIMGYLRNKTRILVTHQLQFLKKADVIIVLNEGTIEAQGTFEQLTNSSLDFTRLLAVADESVEEEPHHAIEEAKMALNRKLSVNSKPESLFEHTIRDDGNEENINYENTTPFLDYLRSVGNYCLLMVVFVLFVMSMAACTATDYWVAFWTTQEDLRRSLNGSSVKSIFEPFFDEIDSNGVQYTLLKTEVSIYVYTALILSAIVFTVSRAMFFYKMAMKASKNIHKKMFHCLLQAPMRFFDTNPSGRVLNRFSKDMGAIDEVLPRVLMDALTIILVMAGILVNVIISNYYMVIAIILLGIVFMKLRKWYIASAKDIKHLEGIAKSPMFSHISSTLHGLTTIRASNAEKSLIKEFDEHQNVHSSAWVFTLLCIVSFGLWLDIVSVIFVTVVTFGFVVATEFGYVENGSLVGLALSQSLILTGMVQYGMRQTAEVINQLTSVDRVMQYTKLETEGPFHTLEGQQPKEPFPSKGQIEFKNMNLIYVRGEPPVLKNLNFIVKPGEKIGIVGRTGAGKSSLIWALFNLTTVDGQILIDGVDTKTLGLSDLRKKISIIPQEPVLFSASLRYNLDPFDEFDDKRLWEVLEEVELKDIAQTLDHPVSEGGSNFSLGQRQLVCLARALLRNNKILVLDEATANVDARTDGLIQTTIRKKFKDCTVLTVAHRLNTIMDSTKVLVMGSGEILEFDHPHELLQIPDGYFVKMVQETGSSMTEQLKQVALQAWLNQQFDVGSDLE